MLVRRAFMLLLLVFAGCASDAPAPPAALPPDGTAAMARAFDGPLRKLGWRVQRSELEHQDVDPGPADPPGRRHLALYVRPLGQPDNADYIRGLASVAKLFVPSLFARHSELLSFDVCLEPTAAVDPSDEPKPVTQVFVSREQLPRLDWARAGPADMVAGAARHPNALGLFVAEGLRASPEWAAIEHEAAIRG
jgi:hypothetical protein